MHCFQIISRLCCLVKLDDALCCLVKLDDALCCLCNVDDAMCYLHNPTSFSRRTTTTTNELPDDVLAQILVRLPPHPTWLLIVSMTHKKWRYIMGSNYFRKQTLSNSARIPLLGFFTNNTEDNRFISKKDLCPAIL
jgi:hypothetical protein